ncbi:uncharacterized protein LOC129765576 [Toxorhynchites rutilus septentrionalis]|uniref:uncharacterized protein LOC129765576 n=1 Tax=Toxorhynchites rutilus septentrionalis TaxID=329112 RepID=UPI00247AB1C8|nr:uncharacterized protein LOC129765576 [Toxorhynchites rutilus septentrionalis]
MRSTSSSKKPSSLKVLTTKLKEMQATVNDIGHFVDRYKEDTTIGEVEVRLERLENLLEKYGETLIEIKVHDDFDPSDGTYDEERHEFCERFYHVKSFLKDKMRGMTDLPVKNQSVCSEDNPIPHTHEHVRLPQIRLQTFNGDIDEWISFRDLFISVIHSKPDLPEVEKLHYLKGCLIGEPRNLIDPLQITTTNYHIAWEMLLKRYNDSKQLRRRQVQSLFSLPTINKESIAELHELLEGFERTVQTLDQIIQQVEYKDLLLVNILTSRLDPVTRRGWEEFTASKERDTVADLTEFIRRRIHVLESMPMKTVSNSQQPVTKPKAAGMNVSDREALLRTHALCRNCFRTGHQAKDCQSRFSCRKCKGRHHTLVCFKLGKDGGTSTANSGKTSSSNNPIGGKGPTNSTHVANLASNSMISGTVQQYSSQVLLATAVVLLDDDDGNQYPARALLDSGSESNFLSIRLSQFLKVNRDKVDISVLGIGQTSTRVNQRIYATVKSRVSNFSRELNFLVLPRVTVNLPTANVNTIGWRIPEGVELADPSFCISKSVDVVLGIESFFDYFETGRRISLGENLPSLNESVFGWIVCGGLSVVNHPLRINCNMSTAEKLEELVTRFWSCEEVGTSKGFSPEETRCELFYANTVRRETDGRFTVSLPRNGDVLAQLGESRDIALRRLHGTERRLARDDGLREQYIAFMSEYQQLGHMRKVVGEEINPCQRCYLPHHPVIKEASTTTKVRVVFDASCKTKSGKSLNDCLLVGPIIQDDLRSIILRCRIKQIMLVADVEKMFRQINVHQEDRSLQCILWRESPSEEVSVYELNTVTYGTKSAPFLATRTLKQLAMEEEQRFPIAARAVSEDTYMDDVLTGTDDVEEALRLRFELEKMMESGGFRLRKWASNHPDVLRDVPKSYLAIPDSTGIVLDAYPSVKTLGLIWIPKKDVFKFHFTIPPVEHSEVLTKRLILSRIATLFDPEGDIGPVITTAKICMQSLWTLTDQGGNRLDWDQPLPPTVCENWKQISTTTPFAERH